MKRDDHEFLLDMCQFAICVVGGLVALVIPIIWPDMTPLTPIAWLLIFSAFFFARLFARTLWPDRKKE